MSYGVGKDGMKPCPVNTEILCTEYRVLDTVLKRESLNGCGEARYVRSTPYP
jgi:hypothetical protein